MASDKNPKERAVKKKSVSSKGKIAQGVAAAAGAAAAAKAVKSSKHKGIVAVIVAICFVAGIAAGFFGLKIVTKNDGFGMTGDDFLEIQMYGEYEEQGAKAMFFGKDRTDGITVTYYYREDISHDAQERDNVDTSVAGFYYAVYRSDAFPYRGIDLIRTIEIVRTEDDGQAE